eukprot:5120002-Lingulodinium_polyedra.AAC.1
MSASSIVVRSAGASPARCSCTRTGFASSKPAAKAATAAALRAKAPGSSGDCTARPMSDVSSSTSDIGLA